MWYQRFSVSLSPPVAIIRALKPLRQQGVIVVLGGECTTINVDACWYLSAFMLVVVSFSLLIEVGVVVVLWIYGLGLAVFLGYCLRLHAYYVQINKKQRYQVLGGYPQMA